MSTENGMLLSCGFPTQSSYCTYHTGDLGVPMLCPFYHYAVITTLVQETNSLLHITTLNHINYVQ